MKPWGLVVGRESQAATAAWSWLRLDQVSTPPGELKEYRPTANVVSVATGGKRSIQVTLGDGPPVSLEVTPGQIHILPANVPVGIRLFGPAENIVVSLSSELLSEVRPGGGRAHTALRPVFGLRDGLIEQLVYALWEQGTSARPDSHYVQTLAAALAAHLVRTYGTGPSNPPVRNLRLAGSRLASVLAYIDENIDRRLTLPRLATVARLSLFAFVRSFKSSTGLPPHRYILRKRVEHAKVLLADDTLSIADVALRCGFGDQSAFANAFRKLTLQTPRAYRGTLR
jgi:AraC family transcriptional regulator